MKNNLYNRHQVRLILRESKKATSLEDFKKRLESKGIKTTIKNHPARKMDSMKFEKKDFELNNIKGKDRAVTDLFRQNVLQNIEKTKQSKKNAPEYNRFAEIRKNRELKTSMESQSMYSNKGLKR